MSLTKFQPTLATTLFDLSHLYRVIEQEKRRLVDHKMTYSTVWFRSRMQFLSNQQELLNRAIAVGRGIGDAFACFFYERDRHYLVEHLAQPAQHHTPPGIGGAGELEFVKQVALIRGHFVLYHGNTNILRLGDITLIDLKNLRVAGIGELKSQSVEPGNLEISLLYSGPNIGREAPLVDSPNPAPVVKPRSIGPRLSPSGQARLKRQIQRISNSYKKLGSTSDKHLTVEIDGQFSDLSEFIANLKAGQVSYRQLGKSLLLVGYKETKKSLYKRLANSARSDIKSKLVDVGNHARGLVTSDRDDNAIIVGNIYYDSGGKTHHLPGMSHLVWWPLSQETIKSILFQEVTVTTLHNPAHFFALLEKAGFIVEETGALRYKVHKKRDGLIFVVEGMTYYLAMIQQYLFSEDAIISLLRDTERELGDLNKGEPLKIDLHIEQRFGLAPI